MAKAFLCLKNRIERGIPVFENIGIYNMPGRTMLGAQDVVYSDVWETFGMDFAEAQRAMIRDIWSRVELKWVKPLVINQLNSEIRELEGAEELEEIHPEKIQLMLEEDYSSMFEDP
jgi:hypothetical protein